MPLEGESQVMSAFQRRADQLLRALALEGLGRLIKHTPVKTGRARNNWNLGLGSPDTTQTGEGEYDKTGATAMKQAIGEVEGVDFGTDVFLTNSLPYIPALNNGHSGQAAKGWIERVVAELQPLADRIARDLQGT